MGSLAVAHTNLIDDATLTASDSSLLLPVTRLQDPHVKRRWRSTTLTPWVLTTLIGPFNLVVLKGLTVSEDCTLRVRISSADSTGATGDSFDETFEHGDPEFDVDYGALVVLLPSSLTGYLRIDFDENDSGRTYVQAGRLGAYVRHQFSFNFTPGASLGWNDPSIAVTTVGGQTITRRKDKFRTFNASLDWVTESDRNGFVETMDRVNGRTEEVVFIIDPDSDNLARDTILGLAVETSPVGFTNIYDSSGPLFTKTWQIKERL